MEINVVYIYIYVYVCVCVCIYIYTLRLKVSGAKLNFRLQMSNLTRIQPQVSLIINYTGVQQTVDYKRVLLKENPFPFHAVSNGTTWKRNVTKLI